MTRGISLSSFFLLLLFGAALLGGCQNAGPAPLPRPERADFPGGATRLSLDLPGHFTANAQSIPVPPEAAPFVLSMTRYQTGKETGIELQITAVRFDDAAVAGRFGPVRTPARQKFYAVFQDTLLSALPPEFKVKDAAAEISDARETLSVDGRDLTVLSVDYISGFQTPGKFKTIFIPDDREAWLITILYDGGDEKLPAEIERIIQSIRVTG